MKTSRHTKHEFCPLRNCFLNSSSEYSCTMNASLRMSVVQSMAPLAIESDWVGFLRRFTVQYPLPSTEKTIGQINFPRLIITQLIKYLSGQWFLVWGLSIFGGTLMWRRGMPTLSTLTVNRIAFLSIICVKMLLQIAKGSFASQR